MKRIPLILSPALLLLLPAIALYPMLHASAEKDGVDSSTAIQEAAPSEAAPSEAAPSEAAPSEAAPSEAAPTEAAPSEAAPSEAAPSEAAPSEAAPSEAAPSEAAPSEAAPSEAAPSEAAPSDSAVAAPVAPAAVSGSIETDDFLLTDGQQQALHRYMTAYHTTLGDLTVPSTDGVFCADDIAAYEQAVGNDPSQSRPGMILCILGWK